MPPAKRRRRDDTLLLDLPDCVLSRVLASLAPAPDLFAVAATCKRLRTLAASPTLTTILVSPVHAGHAARGLRDPRPPPARLIVASLAAALAAARPGDTVRLAPVTHACPDFGLVINRPLRLVGAGPAHSRIAAARAGTPTLTLAAPGGGVAVDGVTLAASPAAPALMHAAGAARVTGCSVRAAPCALGHLHPPIASVAVAAPSFAPASVRAACPGGSLTIAETIVSGARGGAAVRAGGSGGLTGVRAMPLSGGGVLLWAAVDAAVGAGGRGGEEEEEEDVCGET